MIIEEDDFRLTQINEHSPKWDLELIHIVRPKGKEPRKEFKNAGYGLPLEAALERIIQYRLHNKYNEDAVRLKDYLKEYKDERRKLSELVKV